MKISMVGLCLLATMGLAHAAPPDVVFRTDGSSVAGTVKTADAKFLRIAVQLAANQPAAELSVPISTIERIDFGEQEALAEYVKKADRSKRAEVERFWTARKPLLGLANSMAGAFGLLLGNFLLDEKQASERERALTIFQEIETGDWSEERQSKAREGRLRALVKLGRADQAIKEANAMTESDNAPEVVIEAKFVLAEARTQQLKKLEDENPRWQIDDRVRPERERLYHEALDLYLYPFLFQGAREEESARGLWRATELYQFAGEKEKAIETARDVAILYPDTSYVSQANSLLDTLPAKKKSDEKKARLK